MDRKKLEQLYDRYDKRAMKASDNYQETGIARYQYDWHTYDELTEALGMALSAEDEHTQLMNLKSMLVDLASRSERGEDISQDLLKMCIGQGIYRSVI